LGIIQTKSQEDPLRAFQIQVVESKTQTLRQFTDIPGGGILRRILFYVVWWIGILLSIFVFVLAIHNAFYPESLWMAGGTASEKYSH
jgi:uncharacterized integral membrane protein